MFIDSHAHLNDVKFDADREEMIRRAREEYGVSKIINVGFNRETIEATLQLIEQYDFIFGAVGWHPVDAIDCTEEDLLWIKELTQHQKVIALGEMGLDYYWDRSPREIQAKWFRKQIRLAKEVGLPIIIHNREADIDVLQILKEENADEVGGVLHCFGGDEAMMVQALELNFMIGLGGPVTFKNGHLAKRIAKEVPLDKLLIETDCPYLAPHPYRGKRNETGYVRLVAETIAEIRDIRLEQLAEITSQNASRLFRI
ncbi:TatD family hydrolase [Hazenella sp. IB182357]|uniref:TatD family hydrolase n=1 Tax=Polycladospora coralii TaxID=2771432 RepID=A0A926N6N1_9BACL|nr:TatD family hydrolase [Polycladospora coralii]MBS7531798.1 TatD family hydrolase [Polycladospora coralii]